MRAVFLWFVAGFLPRKAGEKIGKLQPTKFLHLTPQTSYF